MAEAPFVRRVADLDLEPAPLDQETILEGSPEVSELVLDTSPDGRVVRGVWRIHETVRKVFQITETGEPG